ncbi:MAG TPA: hypothetical protein VMS17_05075 [Gemmataceae bacterium]|nr:hypothetical protein [Gemmataceae bacterium]
MRRLLWIAPLVLLTGCRNIEGPRAHRDNPVQIDDPRLTLDEQKRLEHDRLALPLDSPTVGPPTFMQSPGAPDPSAVRGH